MNLGFIVTLGKNGQLSPSHAKSSSQAQRKEVELALPPPVVWCRQ